MGAHLERLTILRFFRATRPARGTPAANILALLVICGLAMVGCVREEIAADLDPPPIVQITTRTPDAALIEQGIDAVPDGDFIYLSWLPSDADDLAGYRLYRQAEDTTARQRIADLEANIIEYEDHDSLLAPNQETGLSKGFFYWVTAYDEGGNESGLSEEAYYRLMAKPDLNQPVVGENSLILSWSYTLDDPFDVDYYVIRLLWVIDNEWTPFWVQTHQEYSQLNATYYESLASGTYRFQVDVVGATPQDLPSGSESWLEFEIP